MLTAIPLTLIWFLLAVGLLVAIHEFGHFYVARRCGVKVLRYSVGFGRPLWRRLGRDGTEYTIGAIPLGGYVKMLDERETDVPAAIVDQSFNRKPVGQRMAIVAAGPAINLAFAVLAFWLMFMTGVREFRPLLGEPTGIALESGLKFGDEIKSVDGQPVATWTHALIALVARGSRQQDASLVVRGADGLDRELTLGLSKLPADLKEPELLKLAGLQPWDIDVPAVIGGFGPNSTAAAANLKVGDRIVAINDQPIAHWRGLIPAVQQEAKASPDHALDVRIERLGEQIDVRVPTRAEGEGAARVYRLGISAPPLTDAERAKREQILVTFRYGPIDALGNAFSEAWRFTTSTLDTIWLMLTGQASVTNISGPITIAQVAKQSADDGLARFLWFLAVVSLSLGILNLLPIPVLDGGHLLYYTIEWLKGSPLSDSVQIAGQYVGMALLGALMILAFHNDIARLFQS
jgi:regulator of sigma E protease